MKTICNENLILTITLRMFKFNQRMINSAFWHTVISGNGPIIIGGFFITTASALFSMREKWKKSSDTDFKKSNGLAVILFVISVLGAGLTFYASLDSIQKENKSNISNEIRQKTIDIRDSAITQLEKQNQILLARNLEYTNLNLSYSKKLDSSEQLTLKLSQQISYQAQNLSDYQLGTGSFCYLDLGMRGPIPMFKQHLR